MYQDTKTREYTKPDLNAQFREGEVEWDGKWQNMYPLKDGRAVYGDNLFDKRADAARAAQLDIQDAFENYRTWKTKLGVLPVALFCGYAIQLPVKE